MAVWLCGVRHLTNLREGAKGQEVQTSPPSESGARIDASGRRAGSRERAGGSIRERGDPLLPGGQNQSGGRYARGEASAMDAATDIQALGLEGFHDPSASEVVLWGRKAGSAPRPPRVRRRRRRRGRSWSGCGTSRRSSGREAPSRDVRHRVEVVEPPVCDGERGAVDVVPLHLLSRADGHTIPMAPPVIPSDRASSLNRGTTPSLPESVDEGLS